MLGSILVTQVVSNVENGLTTAGVPAHVASRVAHAVSSASVGSGGSLGHASPKLVKIVQLDFASATKTVIIGMAGAMAVAFVLAFARMPSGRAGEQPVDGAATEPAAAAAGDH